MGATALLLITSSSHATYQQLPCPDSSSFSPWSPSVRPSWFPTPCSTPTVAKMSSGGTTSGILVVPALVPNRGTIWGSWGGPITLSTPTVTFRSTNTFRTLLVTVSSAVLISLLSRRYLLLVLLLWPSRVLSLSRKPQRSPKLELPSTSCIRRLPMLPPPLL